MAKMWTEVVNSEGYQKLPDAEKAAAQQQYFDQVVAPKVPEDDIEIARKQFFDYASGLSTKAKAPANVPSKNVGGPEDRLSGNNFGEDVGYIYNTPVDPLAGSVVTKGVMPEAAPKQARNLPVKPEVLKAFEARYDAATPQQRKVLEAQPNWMGDIARSRAEQMGQFDVARSRAPGKTLERVDPRVEARTQALIDKGENPEFAKVAAEEAAGAGVTPGREIDYMRYQGLASNIPVDEEVRAEFEKASTAKRAIERGRSALRQDIYGLVQFGADMVGADEFSRQRGLDIAGEEKLQASIGANPEYWKRDFEDAGASIAQQAPIYVVSAVSGGAPLGLSSMWVQQFGGAYAESKKMGLDQPEASERAAWMATAEVLGEIPSFGKELKLIRGVAKTAPLDWLKKWTINTATNEAVGEELTYGLQTFGDVKGVTPFGTKEAPTPKEFVEGMVQTLKQTFIQSAMMGGTAATVGKAAQVLTGRKPEQELPQVPAVPSAEQIAKEKGFLTGVKKKEEAPQVAEAAAPEQEAAKKADLRQMRVDEIATTLVDQGGLPPEDAIKVAEKRVAEEDAIELKRQDLMQKEVAKRKTLVAPPKDRVDELTQDFLDAGFPPAEAKQRATTLAQQEAEDDAIAEAEAKGAKRARKSVTKPSQPSVGVPVETTNGLPAGGTSEAVTAGLGATGTTTGESTVRKAVQPDTLTGKLSLREPTEEEVSVNRINKVLNLGNGAAVGFSIDGDVVILNKDGAEDGVVRHYDQRKGAIRTPEEFPAYVPEALRQPLINYNVAAYKDSKLNTPETKAETQAAIQEIVAAANTINKTKPETTNVAEATEAQQAETQGQEAPAAVAAEPKKRGRPALAPELKTASDQKRAKQAKDYKAVEKKLNDAKQLLADSSAPIDEGAVESEEQLREMLDDKRRQRNEAIRALYDISKINRGKPGQRAAEALKDPSITQKELVDAAAGHEVRKQAARTSAMSKVVEAAAADTVADKALGKVTNGAQAISQIVKTGNEFQKILAKRIRSSVNNVKIVVIEADQALPEKIANNPRFLREWNRARALYVEGDFTKEKTVYVRGESFGADQGVNNITMLHELLHAATNRKIQLAKQAIDNGQYEDSNLVRAFDDLVKVMDNAGARFNELADQGKLPKHISNLARFGNIFDDPREFLAYGMTDPAMQEFLMTAHGEQSLVGYFNQFVDSIRRFFRIGLDDANALADLINATDSLLTARPVGRLEAIAPEISAQAKDEDDEDAIRSQKKIERDERIAQEQVNLSRQGEELAKSVSALQALRDPSLLTPAMRRIWKSATTKQRQLLVNLPTTEFLADWGGSFVPELKNTDVLLQKMSGLNQQLLNSVAVLAQTVHRAFKEDSTLQKKLEDVVYTSTLAQIDPSNTKALERSKTLDAKYKALGEKGQQLYKLIKQHYENTATYFSHLLDEQILNSQITPEARNRLMAMVRSMYEAGKKISPYFPLVRRGDYWLRIGSGKYRRFYTFESMADRDKAAEEFAKERRTPLATLKEDGDFELGDDIRTLRSSSADSSTFLKGIFDAIDAENLQDENAREELKDSIYQLYLATMPEQSFRRQFINRKNITGFSTDLLRNIATTGIKTSSQLAKLKYSPLLRNSISAARDSILGRTELEPFVSQMQKRVTERLNPPKDTGWTATAQILNRASYLYYLSGMSTALVQPVSVFQTGMPILGSRYGYVNATKEMAKMLKVWEQYGVTRDNPDGTVSFVPPSISNAKGFSADEKRAVRDAMGRDVLQSTYASDLFGYDKTPTMEFGSAWNTTKRSAAILTGGLLHSTERLSREMMYLTSYRLNRQAGKSHDEAVDAAVKDTNDALGNYGQYNRPPIMQKGLGRVMLQFTMYPLHITLFLLRNLKSAALDKGVRWESTKILFGTLGNTFLIAGAAGLPLFSVVMGALSWFWDNDEDKPKELKDMDYETWWRNVWVPEHLGQVELGGVNLGTLVERGAVNAMTGVDLASRTSLNDLWWRDTKETKTARESLLAYAVERAGPSANMALNLADGYTAFSNGQYQKGVEKISPALIRNLAVTYKLAKEGVKNNKGAEIIASGSFGSGHMIAQAVGFRPDLLVRSQQLAFKLAAIDQRLNNERTKLMNQLDEAYREGDVARYEKVFKTKDKFNAQHPEKQITIEQIAASIEKRQEQRGMAIHGTNIDEHTTTGVSDAVLNMAEEIEKQERKHGARK